MASLIFQGLPGAETPRAHKVLVAAKFLGVNVTVQPNFDRAIGDTQEYLLRSHPLGKFPTLQTPEGPIFESNAILRYLARVSSAKQFYGASALEASEVDQWLDFAATELDRASFPFVKKFRLGTEVTAEDSEALNYALSGLESWLEIRTFLVGERMTIADIAVAFSLQFIYRMHFDAESISKKFKNAYRLYNTVMHQPQTVEVLSAYGGSFGVPKKAEEPKPVKKAEEAKPAKKEEKKKDEDEDEEEVVVEKKKPNPLDLLPPSPFVLDAFKREYSNTDTRTVAAPYFFANFDKEGFSAFWCKYKYNEDNKMQFMTANFIRGWFQRMEHTRKYAFGIALICGEEKKHEVSALWVFRGKGLPEIVAEVEDTELFEWTEIADLTAEKDKITDYLCWEGPTIGLPVLEGRCFK